MEAGAQKPLSGLVEKVLFDLKKNQNEPKNKINEVWQEVAGSRIGKHSQPYKLHNDQLLVFVDDPSWAFELQTRYKAALLKRLQSALGERTVKDIRFKVGKW